MDATETSIQLADGHILNTTGLPRAHELASMINRHIDQDLTGVGFIYSPSWGEWRVMRESAIYSAYGSDAEEVNGYPIIWHC